MVTNTILLSAISILIVSSLQSVFAGGPRLDYDETYEDIPGAPDCWVDGYDAGFAEVCVTDRANQGNDIPGDQYNRSWSYGCSDRGLTEDECNAIKNDPDDNVKHESLQKQNR